ncbi:MAG: hypothetical protein HQ559_04430 [Lentisphaerae bacterium]|nr:hypothetical protein [Lentisphaerota bacterium]
MTTTPKKTAERMRTVLVAFFLVCLACDVSASFAEGDIDLGPLFSRDTDLDGNRRLRALGPLFESKRNEAGEEFQAVRPFFSISRDPERDRTLRHFAWPLAMSKDFLGQRFWHCLLAFGNDYDLDTPGSRYRFVVFPLLFMGRDKHGEDYFALFPFGGKLRETLGRDEWFFVLFPLYSYQVVNDVRTHDILWPLISSTVGKDERRFRVAPFYGEARKEGRWKKRFVLWPLWSFVELFNPEPYGNGFLLFPLFGHLKTDKGESWTVLPPFFRYGKSEDRVIVNCPWPLVQYSSGVVDKLHIWPFWGRREQKPLETGFVLWPFFSRERIDRVRYVQRRYSLLPFARYDDRTSVLREDGEESAGGGEVIAKYVKIWPLFSYNREGDKWRVRALELWPLKDTVGIERNYAPFWTIYTQTARPDQRECEALWGMYRYRRDGESAKRISLFPLFRWAREGVDPAVREWDVLLGLFGSRGGAGKNRRYRFLYGIDVGRRREEEP